MKKNSTTKQDNYELKDEYDLSKMTILPKGRFDPKRRIGKNVVVPQPWARATCIPHQITLTT